MKFSIYLLKFQWGVILVSLLIFGGLTFASIAKPEWHQSIAWAEAIAGFGTLVFAIFIWHNAVKREWKDSLPKIFDAYFLFNGQNVFVFKDINVLNESDIRAWAQQIARQKAGGDISFQPYFRYKNLSLDTTADKKKKVQRYEITFFLTVIPDSLKTRLHYTEGVGNKMYIEWMQREHEDGSITMEEYIQSSNTKM